MERKTFSPSLSFIHLITPLCILLSLILLFGQDHQRRNRKRFNFFLDEKQKPGYPVIRWDGKNDYGVQVATGTYFYRIKAGDFVKTQKLLLIR